MVISLILGILLSDLSVSVNNDITDTYLEQPIVNSQVLPKSEDRAILAPQKIIINGVESIGIDLTARSAIVVDVRTGNVLFEKNNQKQNSIASLTKLMTALVFIDHNPGWNKVVTLQKSDERDGAQAHIYRGESVSMHDLFYTSLIGSDNNSTIALARLTGLSLDSFIKEMNKKASQLGLSNTKFVDPTGLEDGNKSSAFDISKLVFYSMKIPEIKQATQSSKYLISIINKGQTRTIFNTDILLDSYINKEYTIEGGKTGFTPEAGSCLAIQLKGESNNPIIVVVMGSHNNSTRFKEVKALTQWTYDNYTWN